MSFREKAKKRSIDILREGSERVEAKKRQFYIALTLMAVICTPLVIGLWVATSQQWISYETASAIWYIFAGTGFLNVIIQGGRLMSASLDLELDHEDYLREHESR